MTFNQPKVIVNEEMEYYYNPPVKFFKILFADLKGALAGAAQGAAIGSVIPAIGAVPGAIGGAVIGGAAASIDAAGLVTVSDPPTSTTLSGMTNSSNPYDAT